MSRVGLWSYADKEDWTAQDLRDIATVTAWHMVNPDRMVPVLMQTKSLAVTGKTLRQRNLSGGISRAIAYLDPDH